MDWNTIYVIMISGKNVIIMKNTIFSRSLSIGGMVIPVESVLFIEGIRNYYVSLRSVILIHVN